MRATTTARQAARSPQMRGLARLGLAARATIYLLIGWLALLLATGKRHGETDQRGALNEVARHTGGEVLLWVITAGLAAYALWRLSEAAFGAVGEGDKKGPRIQSLVRGVIYAGFAVSAFTLVTHARQQSQVRQQQTLTAKVMAHTGGRWAVGIVGAIIVIVGLMLVVEGLTQKFEKHLDLNRMSATTRLSSASWGPWARRHGVSSSWSPESSWCAPRTSSTRRRRAASMARCGPWRRPQQVPGCSASRLSG
jgi:hypothetical protein